MYGENIKTTESGGGVIPGFIGFARGVLIAAVATVISFSLFACLLAYTGLKEQFIPVIAVATEGIGAFLSGFFAAKGAKARGFLFGIGAGILYIALIRAIGVLACGGSFLRVHMLWTVLISAASGALGGIFGVNTKENGTNRRKR